MPGFFRAPVAASIPLEALVMRLHGDGCHFNSEEEALTLTQSEVRINAPRSRVSQSVHQRADHLSCHKKNVDEEAILRLIELSPAKKWPVQFMLAQAFPWSCITLFMRMMTIAVND
jgi:hypothetical protein